MPKSISFSVFLRVTFYWPLLPVDNHDDDDDDDDDDEDTFQLFVHMIGETAGPDVSLAVSNVAGVVKFILNPLYYAFKYNTICIHGVYLMKRNKD